VRQTEPLKHANCPECGHRAFLIDGFTQCCVNPWKRELLALESRGYCNADHTYKPLLAQLHDQADRCFHCSSRFGIGRDSCAPAVLYHLPEGVQEWRYVILCRACEGAELEVTRKGGTTAAASSAPAPKPARNWDRLTPEQKAARLAGLRRHRQAQI